MKIDQDHGHPIIELDSGELERAIRSHVQQHLPTEGDPALRSSDLSHADVYVSGRRVDMCGVRIVLYPAEPAASAASPPDASPAQTIDFIRLAGRLARAAAVDAALTVAETAWSWRDPEAARDYATDRIAHLEATRAYVLARGRHLRLDILERLLAWEERAATSDAAGMCMPSIADNAPPEEPRDALAQLLDGCSALLRDRPGSGVPLRAVEQIVDHVERRRPDLDAVVAARLQIEDVRARAKAHSLGSPVPTPPSMSQQGALPMDWRSLKALLDLVRRTHGSEDVLGREVVLRLDVDGKTYVGGLRSAGVEDDEGDEPALVLDGDDGVVVAPEADDEAIEAALSEAGLAPLARDQGVVAAIVELSHQERRHAARVQDLERRLQDLGGDVS